jgi:serine/threonine-protein kinase RsbW
MVSDIPFSALPMPLPPERSAADCRRVSVRSLSEVHPLTEQFAADLATAGFPEKEIFGMRLAFEEALVNGIRHGNGGDPSKQVRVQYGVTPQQVLVSIEDEGPGFNPDAIPDPLAEENLDRPGGRGVYLMRCYMTWVQYNDRGNAVTMCKKRN